MKLKERSAYTVMTTGMIKTHVVLGALVEFLGEGRDVDAVLTERGADRGRGSCLASGDLQLNVADYFLCHFRAPP